MARCFALLTLSLVAMVSVTAHAGSLDERRIPAVSPAPGHAGLRAAVYAAFPRPEGRWGAIHVVDRSSQCSAPVVAHLLARGSVTDLDELVVVIDRDGALRDSDRDLVRAGYRLRIVTTERAASLLPVAAPTLIIARPDGSLGYVGGHRSIASSDASLGYGHRSPADPATTDSLARYGFGAHGPQTNAAEGSNPVGARGRTLLDITFAPTAFADVAIASELVTTGATDRQIPVVGCSE